MRSTIKIKLSIMMFLEFFIWGAWFVSLGPFLAQNLRATGVETGSVFSTQSWGAIIAPFIIGLIADKYFNAERILAVLHIVGAVLMYQMYNATSVGAFYPYVLGYMILYMPTLALVNSVSFNQMQDPEKNFPAIRVWGTIGWIVAGAAISYLLHWDSPQSVQQGLLKNTFLMASISSLVLGLFSFTLPATPPKIKGQKVSISQMLGLDALKLLKDRNFLVFFIASILICIPLAFYYSNASNYLVDLKIEKPLLKMTIGQFSEAAFILCLPLFFKKFGIKKTILVGMLGWALRYALFAYGNGGDLAFMLIVGIALHGVCYDFFFVAGQIYTDSKAGPQYKSAAQGLITLATYGVGMLIGFYVAGLISDAYNSSAGHDWRMIWLIPAGIAAVVMLLFAALFRNGETVKAE
ncbi:nucleoside permease [Mucilaginibacter boryungensis]|uniref:Nucleoside permease n=1 Tax=Mucilaginibacter boryungensis TaxID=768480 RepID=A0ABR9XK01_9SPHI|nr:nucleoside permease [Mucilaginibacter boryungensis]MBE9667369.1 nucleoside permease [Mucilaginibacter boryungensis]